MKRCVLVLATMFSTAQVAGCATGFAGPGEGGAGGEGGIGSSSTSGGPASGTGSTSTGSTSTTSSGEGGGTSSTTSSSSSTSAASTTSSTASTTSSTSTGGSTGGELLFSEYVEGTSNNKALEITNLGPGSVMLGDCVLERYQNGSATKATSDIAVDAVTLAPGASFVICHTSFAQPSLCDQLDGGIYHNGNDAIALVCEGIRVDVFGRIGEDANWGTAPTTSVDATLRRKCSVTSGDTNGGDAFDPAVQWNGYPTDTFSDLGLYDCP